MSDTASVSALLTAGFASWRDAAFWDRALDRLAHRCPPAGLPQFGYVLEASGAVVGVLLLIASERRNGNEVLRQINVSSWFVQPAFRVYGTLLVRQALRHRDAVFVNVTPAPETWPILEAQGYRRYGGGRAMLLPWLARRGGGNRVWPVGPAVTPQDGLTPAECDMLHEHRSWGCLCLIGETPSGRTPFIFGLRKRRGLLPFAYLLHARSLDSLVLCARPLGLALARRGVFVVVVDAEQSVAGIPGWFKPGFPKFFRGKHPPDASDLAYTERAIFGV